MSMVRSMTRPMVRSMVRGMNDAGVFPLGAFSLLDTQGLTLPAVGDSDDNRMSFDNEGLAYYLKAEEMRVKGLRRWENELSFSEDLTNAAWGAFAGAVVDDAETVTLSTTQFTSIAQIYVFPTDYATRDYILSVDLKLISGDSALHISIGNTLLAITVTSEWQRFYIAGTSHQSGATGVQVIQNRAGSPTETVVKIRKAQFEESTGRADTTTPSEYISTNALSTPWHGANVDGVKFSQYENGNTVASNVVTEAQGAAIDPSTIVGYAPSGDATEESGRSNDIATWPVVTTAAVAKDAIGITGAPNTAETLTDSDNAVKQSRRLTKSMTSGTSEYSAFFAVPYLASQSTYFQVEIKLSGGSALVQGCVLDQSDGSFTQPNSGGTVDVVREGDWWLVKLTLTDNASGNNVFTEQIDPAFNTDGSTANDVTATGSAVFAFCSYFVGAWSFYPILTTGGTTKTALDDTGAQLAGFTFPDAEGSCEFLLTPYFIDNVAGGMGVVAPNSGSLLGPAYFNTSGTARLSANDGTNNVNFANAWSAIGQTVTVKIRWGSGTMRFSVDGTLSASTAYDGSFNPSGLVTLFKSLTLTAGMKTLKFYNTDRGQTWL